MRVISLASGSKGNAYLVGASGAWILIDNGLPYKTLLSRLRAIQPSTSNLLGVLVTHSHTDHVGGLGTFLKHHDIPIFANDATADAVEIYICSEPKPHATSHGSEQNIHLFENGQEFDIGPFSIHPFSIPHDTADPVGYLVRAEGETYFHGTDIGTPLDSIGLKLAEADFATLESNHDPVMLRTSGRPMPLIQRIAGARGHLANEQACDLVRRFASPKLKRLGLAHLSQDCNAPHLAEGCMRRTLWEMNRGDIALAVYAQDVPIELTAGL